MYSFPAVKCPPLLGMLSATGVHFTPDMMRAYSTDLFCQVNGRSGVVSPVSLAASSARRDRQDSPINSVSVSVLIQTSANRDEEFGNLRSVNSRQFAPRSRACRSYQNCSDVAESVRFCYLQFDNATVKNV